MGKKSSRGDKARQETAATQMSAGDRWHWCWVIALLVGLLVALSVYYDDNALDTSHIPRLRGMCVTLFGAVVLLLLPVSARRLDLSILRDPLIICYGSFAAICFATLLFALNPSAGFTDAFKTFGAFIFLCLLCLLLPTIADGRKRLLQVLVCTGLLCATWGFVEMVQRYGLGLHSRGDMSTILATMANVNLYAGFLVLVFPFCLCGMMVLGGWWRFVSAVATALCAVMVILLQTRAAYLGLAASVVAAVVLAIIFAPALGLGRRVRVLLAVGTTAAFLSVVAFYFLAPEGNPLAARLRLTAQGTGDASFGGRVMAWAITLQMAKDHFPWGVGTGNFTIRLDEYFNANTDFRGVGENWIYPHNDFLWVLAEEGLPGALTFFGIFALGFWHCLGVLRNGRSRRDCWMALAVIMALLAYLMDSAFGFPLARVSHQLALAAALALAVLLARGAGAPDEPVARRFPSYPRGLLAGALPVLLILALGFSYCRAAIKQELYLSVVFALEEQEMWPAALRVLRAAASPWKTTDVFATPWAYHEARVLKQTGTDQEVLAALQRAYEQNPNRLHVINDLGSYLAKTGRFNEAVALLAKTVQRYPTDMISRENLAQCYIDQDDYAAAMQVLEKVPEDRRTDAIRTKIAACREMLEDPKPADKAVAP
jgi:O-antigen ligase